MAKIKTVIVSIVMLLSLTACSVDIVDSDHDDSSKHQLNVGVQSMRTTPATGSKLINSSELQVGDILLSRAPSLTSLGVQTFTTSSVSHASLYIGDNQVVEAIRTGVQLIDLQAAIDESIVVAVYRYPELTTLDKIKIREFTLAQQGKKYNFKGIVFMMPYAITRQFCELPPLGEKRRNACLYSLASIQLGGHSGDNQSFFCSQLVLEAYKYAGQPITDAAPAWISPDDLMHMREGDVKSVTPHKELIYVGHLKVEINPVIYQRNKD